METHHRVRKCGDVRCFSQHVCSNSDGSRNQTCLWHAEPQSSKALRYKGMIPCTGRWQDPGLVKQLSKIDFATACPSRVGARHNDQFVVEKHLRFEVVVGKGRYYPLQDAIILSIAQPWSKRFRCARRYIIKMHRYARIKPGKA